MMASHTEGPRRRTTGNRKNSNPYSRKEDNEQSAETTMTANDSSILIDEEEEESGWWQLADGVPNATSVCQDLANLTVQTLVYTPFQAFTGMLPLRRTQQAIKHTVTSTTDTITGAAQDVKSSEIWKNYTGDPTATPKTTTKPKRVKTKKASIGLLTDGTADVAVDAVIDDTEAIGSVRVRVLSANGIGTRETSIRVGLYSGGSTDNNNNKVNATPASTGPSVSFDKEDATFDFRVTDIQSDVCLHIYQANRLSKDSCVGYVTIPILHLASGRRHGLRGRFNVFPTTDGSRVRYVPVLKAGMGEEPRESPGYGFLNLEVQLQLGANFRKSNVPVLPLLHAYMQDPSSGHTSDAALGSGSDRLLLNLQRCRNIGVRVFAPTGAVLGAFFAARAWSNPLVTLFVHILVTYWCLYASTWQVPILVFMYTLLSGYTQSVVRVSAAALGSVPDNGAGGSSIPALGVFTPWRNVQREKSENVQRRTERNRAIASTVASTVNMTMKLQGKTIVGVFETLQVVWLGTMLFTIHIVRRGAERLLPDNTMDKLQALAEPVVMLLPPAIRERVGVAATAFDDYESGVAPGTILAEKDVIRGADVKSISGDDKQKSASEAEVVEEQEQSAATVHHKLSMIQQLNKTVQQVDDAQQLVGSVASYSEKLLNALAFEDRNVSLVLYTLLLITAIVSSASIMAGQLIWVLIAPLLMWPSTGEILCVAINVALLPLDRLLWVVPSSLREMASGALAGLELGSTGGIPQLPPFLMLPEPVSNVLKRAPDDMEVAHMCIAKQMVERGDNNAAATVDEE